MNQLVSLHVERPAPIVIPAAKPSDFLVVSDQDSYDYGVEMVAETKGIWKKIDDQRIALKDGALKSCRDIDEFFAMPLKFYADEETAIKAKLVAYRKELQIAQDKAMAEAAKVAAVEQARLRAEAAAVEKANPVAAAALREEAAVVAPAAVYIAAPVSAGSSARGKWTVEITDKRAFVAHALTEAGTALFGAIEVDERFLVKVASVFGVPDVCPGVKFSRDETLAIKAKR